MPINGRDKGANFELDVAWYVSQWFWGTPRVLRRVPMSGGWSKTMAAGDLISEMDPFPFSVECKFSVSWGFHELFNKGWGTLGSYWDQCTSDSKHQTKHPLLIFKTNNSPVYCAFRTSMLPHLGLTHPHIHALDSDGRSVTFMKLKEEFFKLPFQPLYEAVMGTDLELYPYSLLERLRIKAQEKFPPNASDLKEIAKIK